MANVELTDLPLRDDLMGTMDTTAPRDRADKVFSSVLGMLAAEPALAPGVVRYGPYSASMAARVRSISVSVL